MIEVDACFEWQVSYFGASDKNKVDIKFSWVGFSNMGEESD